MSVKPCIVFRKVTFGYDRKPLLKDFSLEILPKERVALVGANGSGKTTVVRLALGLDVPNSGEIKLLDQVVSRGSHFPDLGYIGDPAQSDDGLGLPLWLTVGEMVKAQSSIRGIRMSQEFAASVFKRLRLADLNNRQISFLSAGERRRLMAYMAVAKGPQLIIADEATEIVSPAERADIIDSIQECRTKFGTSLLWISHEADSTAQIADRIVLLKDGQAYCMPERTLRISMERNGERKEPEAILERRAGYQIREAIEKGNFKQLRVTIERKEEYD